jgi:hypothetical protein
LVPCFWDGEKSLDRGAVDGGSLLWSEDEDGSGDDDRRFHGKHDRDIAGERMLQHGPTKSALDDSDIVIRQMPGVDGF